MGSMKGVILSTVAAAALSFAATSQADAWKQVGQISGGLPIAIVEISPSLAQNRSTYDDAVRSLCVGRRPCSVAFFLPGDRRPSSQTNPEFYRAGGWASYSPVVLWTTDDYTKWDCQRAGAAAAPPSALCGSSSSGVSFREAYSAILSLAGRANTAKACGWPPNDDAAIAQAYIASVTDAAKRRELQEGYNLMMRGKGPDDLAGCHRLRSKIDAGAQAARTVLGR